jgi:hypothetical protein
MAMTPTTEAGDALTALKDDEPTEHYEGLRHSALIAPH